MRDTGKVLIVEDDNAVQELLQVSLEKDGWKVSQADSGEAALLAAVDLVPDVIVLDIMLPGVDGKQVCRQVRSYPKTRSIPIIMISARTQDEDVIAGLNAGADDYLTKPFSPEVLRARVQAVLRRSDKLAAPPSNDPIRIHNMVIDPLRFSVKVDGYSVDVTRADFMVLHLLASDPGRSFTRRQIIEACHDEGSDISERSVDVQIVGLRRKTGRAGRYIETVRGIGYRLKEE